MRRAKMSPEEMAKIQPHPGWLDGREGYLWCRFDAIVERDRMIRAEITWDDDSEDKNNPNADRAPTCYFDPQLFIETNRPCQCCKDSMSHWITVDGCLVELETIEEVTELLRSDPAMIAAKYVDNIANLQIRNQVVE